MNDRNEGAIKSLIAQYQQKVFALVLYLVGQDLDRAYDVCVSSFIEAIQERTSSGQRDGFLPGLIAIAVEKCRNVKTIPNFDTIKLLAVTAAEKEPLLILLKALQKLDFELKVRLLLRFQLNLSYGDIGTIMRISGSDARIETARARAQLDKEIEGMLSDA